MFFSARGWGFPQTFVFKFTATGSVPVISISIVVTQLRQAYPNPFALVHTVAIENNFPQIKIKLSQRVPTHLFKSPQGSKRFYTDLTLPK